MDLKTYIADDARKAALIAVTGINAQYLYQLASGWKGRKPSPKLARQICEATGNIVALGTLRPDLWAIDSPKRRRAA